MKYLLAFPLFVLSSCAYHDLTKDQTVRKVAAESRNCAAVAESKASRGYNQGDLALIQNLRHLEAYKKVCIQDGKRLKGMRFLPTIEKTYYLDAFDCDARLDVVQDMAAEISFKKEFGMGLNAYYGVIRNRIHPDPSKSMTKEISQAISREGQQATNRYNQLRSVRPAQAEEIVSDYVQESCFHETEEEISSRLTLKDCSLPTVSAPQFVPAPKGPTQTLSKSSVGLAMMLKLEKIIQSPESCDSKAQQMKTLFATSKVTSLDDLAYMSYVAKNFETVIHTPALRAIFASAMKGTTVFEPYCDIQENTCHKLEGSMYLMRNAVISSENKALAEEGAPGYDYFETLSAAQKAKVVEEVQQTIDTVIRNPAQGHKLSEAFRDECDGILSESFGDGAALATGSGYGLIPDHVWERDGKVCKKDATHGCRKRELKTASYLLAGYDSFARMHLYADKNLSDDLTRPTFAPDNWTSTGPGGLWATAGSYLLNYKRFGRYRNVIYNPNHLGTPSMLGKRSNPRNSKGWVQIGTIGGIGGGALSDRKGTTSNESPYVHSHLQILQADARSLLNFQDAFCRGKPAP